MTSSDSGSPWHLLTDTQRVRPWMLDPEESPDDLHINHQIGVNLHLEV
ncbi:hypothetical protein [Shewanella oncorhynchi]|nr:hypothetical protein [Shewanella oncorhynchi]WVI94186.1 hypothetical protein VR487_04170 [Shewanella oncorhynchi]